MGGGGKYSEGFSFSVRNVDASSKKESDSPRPYNFKCVKCRTMPLETNLQSIKYSLKIMNFLEYSKQ